MILYVKKAVVTGGSSGIGKAFVHRLVDKGIETLVIARSYDLLEEIIHECSIKSHIKVSYCVADLTVKQDRDRAWKDIEAFSPDLLVQSAGAGYYGSVLDDTIDHQLNLMHLNSTVPFEFCLKMAHFWKQQEKKGWILNISSIAGEYDFPCFTAYASAKACMSRYSVALDHELKNEGIRVFVCCPGQVNTDFFKKASQGDLAHHPSHISLSIDCMIDFLWYQLERQIPYTIFDWKYRWVHRLMHPFLKTNWGRILLQKIILQRRKKSKRTH